MRHRASNFACSIFIVLLTACSKSYTPPAEAGGEQIFQEACAECHKAENKDAPGMIFNLSHKTANLAYITERVHNGSLLMPRFPAITDTKMQALSDYILKHSLIQ